MHQYISPARCRPARAGTFLFHIHTMSLPDDKYNRDIQKRSDILMTKGNASLKSNLFDLYYHDHKDLPEYVHKYIGLPIRELKAFITAHITTLGVHQFEYLHGNQTFSFAMYVDNPASTVREVRVFDLSRGPNAPRYVRSMYVVGPCAGVQYVFP